MHRQTPNSAKRSTKEDYNLQVKLAEFYGCQGACFLLDIHSKRGIPMNEIILGRHLDKLIRRRGQIVMTLHHLAAEPKQVEQNTEWLDQAAYESKVNLLDGLERLVCHGIWPDR